MFDIGFSELVLIFVIGLVVLGPQRLPVAVRTVAGWIRALRSLATTVQGELTKELKLQEFQDSLNKVEKASKANLGNLSPELKASMDELREAAESMKRSYTQHDPEKASDEEHAIRHPHTADGESVEQPSTVDTTPAAAEPSDTPAVVQPEPLAPGATPAQPEKATSAAAAAPSQPGDKS